MQKTDFTLLEILVEDIFFHTHTQEWNLNLSLSVIGKLIGKALGCSQQVILKPETIEA